MRRAPVLHGLFGAGGHGRQVMPFFRLLAKTSDEACVFVVDEPSVNAVNGVPILSWDAFLAAATPESLFCIALGSGRQRRTIEERAIAAGLTIGSARHSSVIEMDNVSIEPGAMLSPHVTISSNVTIGRQFTANSYAYVSHDCVLGDFVTMAPRSTCCGRVRVGDGAMIGAGAVIAPETEELYIAEGARIAAGAVVRRSVPAGALAYGNPARIIRQGDISPTLSDGYLSGQGTLAPET